MFVYIFKFILLVTVSHLHVYSLIGPALVRLDILSFYSFCLSHICKWYVDNFNFNLCLFQYRHFMLGLLVTFYVCIRLYSSSFYTSVFMLCFTNHHISSLIGLKFLRLIMSSFLVNLLVSYIQQKNRINSIIGLILIRLDRCCFKQFCSLHVCMVVNLLIYSYGSTDCI